MRKLIVLLFGICAACPALEAKAIPTGSDTGFFTGKKIRLEKIDFVIGKETLIPGMDSLRPVAEFIKSKPGLVFEIGCHTDVRGSDTFNLRLSERRAKTIYDTLIGMGVGYSRLTWKGYGETELLPVKKNSKGVPYEQTSGRRVELKILRVEKSMSDSVFLPGEFIRIPVIVYSFDDRREVRLRDSLAPVEKFIKAHPELVLEIGCHTDVRGSDKYNEKLSAARAKQIYDILLASGIYAPRLLYKGYGEYQLLVSDRMTISEKDKMKQEALHQLNRRTELKVLAVNDRKGR
ncbi:MAG: hypothetical protein FD123_1089 [Bacteroidetes bacterium]|nr:MAG: hypothetical protein FD123_1089 [Bacteroidota bacterium]